MRLYVKCYRCDLLGEAVNFGGGQGQGFSHYGGQLWRQPTEWGIFLPPRGAESEPLCPQCAADWVATVEKAAGPFLMNRPEDAAEPPKEASKELK